MGRLDQRLTRNEIATCEQICQGEWLWKTENHPEHMHLKDGLNG